MGVDTTTELWRLRPGSYDAIKQGCTCDAIVNFYGNGVTSIIRDEPAKTFVGDTDCPLHGIEGEVEGVGATNHATKPSTMID